MAPADHARRRSPPVAPDATPARRAPATRHPLVGLQRLAGNRATATVARHAAPRGPGVVERTATGVTVQRDGPNDVAALGTATVTQLIDLYLSTAAAPTLTSGGEVYEREFLDSGRGSAQVREAIRTRLPTTRLPVTWVAQMPIPLVPGVEPLLLEGLLLTRITRLVSAGADATRAEQLRAVVSATLNPEHVVAASGTGTRRLTGIGYLERLAPAGTRTNSTNRPLFAHEAGTMETFEGVSVRPEVIAPLRALMDGLHAEGARTNDASALEARVASGFRAATVSEGRAYLRALRKTIRLGVDRAGDPYTYPAFPAALEATAISELGRSGSPAHDRFRDALAASPGWSAAAARTLLATTGQFKAPRGGSAHNSGLVVDIDWPSLTAGNRPQRHGMNRERNADALRSVAGHWLFEHAPGLGFDTYSTRREIWHMEWLNWAGTTADPDAGS